MKTKEFQRELQKEKIRLERELHKIALTIEALAILTGERVAKLFTSRTLTNLCDELSRL
jgi:hypothetical protein